MERRSLIVIIMTIIKLKGDFHSYGLVSKHKIVTIHVNCAISIHYVSWFMHLTQQYIPDQSV